MKEFKYTIDGKEYNVTIGEIDENNVASISVNGSDYNVQMEKEAEPEKKKVVLGKPVDNSTETEATFSANVIPSGNSPTVTVHTACLIPS